MSCYYPLQAYRAKNLNDSGKRGIVFNLKDGYLDMPLRVSCGRCIGCRLKRSREWAIRCVHEASLYDRNCFITLTYDNAHLPKYGTLVKRDFTLFMKRLRKKFGEGIRFYMCGEYGDLYGRPHYHALLFNFDFSDRRFYRKSNSGESIFRSDQLETLWPFGYSSVAECTFNSAAYVARYVTKKISGDQAMSHYAVIDFDSGELLFDKVPEYNCMSRMPGIGRAWYDRYGDQTRNLDKVVVGGKVFKPPKFYDSQFEVIDPDAFAVVKGKRVKEARVFSEDNTLERLRVREKVKIRQFSRLVRNLELTNDT